MQALQQWRFEGLRQHLWRRRCDHLLRCAWAAWRERMRCRRLLNCAVRSLIGASLAHGFSALQCRSLQLSRAERRAWCACMARAYKVWRMVVFRMSDARLRTVEFGRLQRHASTRRLCVVFGAWRSLPSQTPSPEIQAHRAEQWRLRCMLRHWSAISGEHGRCFRRMIMAGHFAAQQQLRKTWRMWLLLYLRGSPQQLARPVKPWSMAGMLPAGRCLDRLSLWAACAAPHRRNNTSSPGLYSSASGGAWQQHEDSRTRMWSLRLEVDKENQPPLPGGVGG